MFPCLKIDDNLYFHNILKETQSGSPPKRPFTNYVTQFLTYFDPLLQNGQPNMRNIIFIAKNIILSCLTQFSPILPD